MPLSKKKKAVSPGGSSESDDDDWEDDVAAVPSMKTKPASAKKRKEESLQFMSDLPEQKPDHVIDAADSGIIIYASASLDSKWLSVGINNNKFVIICTRTRKVAETFSKEHSAIYLRGTSFRSDSKFAVSGASDGTLLLCKLAQKEEREGEGGSGGGKKEEKWVIDERGQPFAQKAGTKNAFKPRHLPNSTDPRFASIAKETEELAQKHNDVNGLAFCPNQHKEDYKNLLAIAHDSQVCVVVDTEAMERVAAIPTDPSGTGSGSSSTYCADVQWSPCCRFLCIAGGADILIASTSSFRVLQAFNANRGQVMRAAWFLSSTSLYAVGNSERQGNTQFRKIYPEKLLQREAELLSKKQEEQGTKKFEFEVESIVPEGGEGKEEGQAAEYMDTAKIVHRKNTANEMMCQHEGVLVEAYADSCSIVYDLLTAPVATTTTTTSSASVPFGKAVAKLNNSVTNNTWGACFYRCPIKHEEMIVTTSGAVVNLFVNPVSQKLAQRMKVWLVREKGNQKKNQIVLVLNEIYAILTLTCLYIPWRSASGREEEEK